MAETLVVTGQNQFGHPYPHVLSRKQLERLLFIDRKHLYGDELSTLVKQELVARNEMDRTTGNVRYPLDDEAQLYSVTDLPIPNTPFKFNVIYAYELNAKIRSVLRSRKWLKKVLEKSGSTSPLYWILRKGVLHFQDKDEQAASLFESCCDNLLSTVIEEYFDSNVEITDDVWASAFRTFEKFYLPSDMVENAKDKELFGLLATNFKGRLHSKDYFHFCNIYAAVVISKPGPGDLAADGVLTLDALQETVAAYDTEILETIPDKKNTNRLLCLVKGLRFTSALLPQTDHDPNVHPLYAMWVRNLTVNEIHTICPGIKSDVLIMDPIMQYKTHKREVKDAHRYGLVGAWVNVKPQLDMIPLHLPGLPKLPRNPSVSDLVQFARYTRPYSYTEVLRYVASYKLFKLFWTIIKKQHGYPLTKRRFDQAMQGIDRAAIKDPRDPDYLSPAEAGALKTSLHQTYQEQSKSPFASIYQKEEDELEQIDQMPEATQAEKDLKQQYIQQVGNDLNAEWINAALHVLNEYRFMELMAKKPFLSEKQLVKELEYLNTKMVEYRSNAALSQKELQSILEPLTEQTLPQSLLPRGIYDYFHRQYQADYEAAKLEINAKLLDLDKKIQRLKLKEATANLPEDEKQRIKSKLETIGIRQRELLMQGVQAAVRAATLIQGIDIEVLTYILDYSSKMPAFEFIPCPQ